MKEGSKFIFVLALVLVLSFSFVSANILDDMWGKFTGEVINGGETEGYWTSWQDRDGPEGSGDYEIISEALKIYPDMCENPIKIECLTVTGRDLEEINQGDKVICNTDVGFYCKNNNVDGNCLDYKVRYFCKEDVFFCGNGIQGLGEQCDGNDWVQSASCEDFGYESGSLSCNNDCTFSFNNCGKKIKPFLEWKSLDEEKITSVMPGEKVLLVVTNPASSMLGSDFNIWEDDLFLGDDFVSQLKQDSFYPNEYFGVWTIPTGILGDSEEVGYELYFEVDGYTSDILNVLPDTTTTVCGNGICEPGENEINCPQDCGSSLLIYTCGVFQEVGDIDGDGRILAYDAALIEKIVVGSASIDDQRCADVDCDRKVTSEDAMLVLDYSVGKIQEFECEEKSDCYTNENDDYECKHFEGDRIGSGSGSYSEVNYIGPDGARITMNFIGGSSPETSSLLQKGSTYTFPNAKYTIYVKDLFYSSKEGQGSYVIFNHVDPRKASCTDSDGGVLPFVKGSCIDSRGVYVKDTCLANGDDPTEDYVGEAFCLTKEMIEHCKLYNDNDYCENLPRDCYLAPLVPTPNLAWSYFDKDEKYFCPNGCEDGACIGEPINETDCKDSDGGLNYYKKGTVSNPNKPGSWAEDTCSDNGITLKEKYCMEGFDSASVNYECPNGCEDGACIGISSYCDEQGNCILYKGENVEFDEKTYIIDMIDEDFVHFVIGTEEGYSGSNPRIAEGESMLLNDGTTIRIMEIFYPTKENSRAFVEFVIGEQPTCTDSDNGLDYYTASYVEGYDSTGKWGKLPDGCVINSEGLKINTLREAICNENDFPGTTDYECPNGCSDGVCIEKTTIWNNFLNFFGFDTSSSDVVVPEKVEETSRLTRPSEQESELENKGRLERLFGTN